ncbi:IPT/TIG domain-containing protein [Sphingobacterium sp. UT-1RO-CII-1]|uniref:IPT/TIG domain-containing protein n=1 Tax=Sphingobacterium sp. UT-1RO-CII-1 TaxID=2995225 RepID=UPI00227BDF32|nr:IPT/TIG domain-containing protein [Sphingobacterium sp. UT-1RO-CII-1]MCY4780190.1 IPT/TIG domain-containing protein [Sphingobacterium sp. UT-1RO-CII-1]
MFKNNALASALSAIVMLCFLTFFYSCSDDGLEKADKPHDPNKPIEITKIYPDSGIYLEKVMISGDNFGTDVDKIRVWFNNKRAAVVGSTGERVYVLAPRLPGDTCKISVVVGKDSVVYSSDFYYNTSVTVTTIAGNGSRDTYRDGDLTQSIVGPKYLCVDKEDNLFMINRVPDQYHVARIDEEANELITLARNVIANVPAADPITGLITFPTETTVGSYYTLDPLEFWGPRIREMRWPEGGDRPGQGYKHSMVFNPDDGYIYTRYYHGHIVKINPRTFEVTPIFKTQQGDSFGLTFNPMTPNVLYISFIGNAGVNAHSICSIDVTNPENSFKKLTGPTNGGHRDGELEVAQFKDPQQIFCDAEGSIYVADAGNHCIRRITTDGMVETVLGMPGTPGWKDGGKEEALFRYPTGIGIASDGSVYVADFDNNRVRKLSIN